jgi:beta-galactosidase GanA
VQLHLNTVLLALGWDWTEPQEGRFDFSLGLLPGTPQIQRVRVYRYQ